MIPDINHANNHSDDPRSPFERPNRANKLVIAIDRESLPNSDALENLLGFGRHEPIHMMSTRDEGVEHIIFGEESNDVLQYRIVPMEGDIDLGNGFRNGLRSAVPSMTQWRQFADEGEKKGYGKANDILNALTLAQLCVDRGVHILVTARNYLLTQAPRNIVKFSNPGTVQEALALVGLYLRTQNDFTYYRRPHPTNRNAGGLTTFGNSLVSSLMEVGGGLVRVMQAPLSQKMNDLAILAALSLLALTEHYVRGTSYKSNYGLFLRITRLTRPCIIST
jgi:hypothetical protein